MKITKIIAAFAFVTAMLFSTEALATVTVYSKDDPSGNVDKNGNGSDVYKNCKNIRDDQWTCDVGPAK